MTTFDTVPTTEDLPASGRPKPKSQGGGFGRYVLVRFLLMFPTIFILVTLVFFLARTTGDPITAAQGGRLGPEALAELRAAAGFDRPLLVQYVEYLGQILTGNFGSTMTTSRPVIEVLTTYGPATFELIQGGINAQHIGVLVEPATSPPCYANCDGSTSVPILNVNDFICFLNTWVSAAGCN